MHIGSNKRSKKCMIESPLIVAMIFLLLLTACPIKQFISTYVSGRYTLTQSSPNKINKQVIVGTSFETIKRCSSISFFSQTRNHIELGIPKNHAGFFLIIFFGSFFIFLKSIFSPKPVLTFFYISVPLFIRNKILLL